MGEEMHMKWQGRGQAEIEPEKGKVLWRGLREHMRIVGKQAA